MAANKIKYSAKRAVFNRYVGSKLLNIMRAAQPAGIWPSAPSVCISWGAAAADIAESAVKDWQACRRHVKRMSTATDRFYQGRTRLSMQNDADGPDRKMMYTLQEKAVRGAVKRWNISSSESEDVGCSDSDDSCDSLGRIEKEEHLEGTNYSSRRAHLVTEMPIHAFTTCSSGSDGAGHSGAEAAPAAALDVSHSFYIQRLLNGSFAWGTQNLCLKSQYMQQQVNPLYCRRFISAYLQM
jgi:hypothetical protein